MSPLLGEIALHLAVADDTPGKKCNDPLSIQFGITDNGALK
jgi:hypothetical protein